MWIVTRSLIGVLVATTTASAVTTCAGRPARRAGMPPSIVVGVRAGEDAAAVRAGSRCARPAQVLQRMELRLAREAQARPGVERARAARARRARRPRRPARCAASSSRLERVALVAVGEEEVAVEPLEVAVDALPCATIVSMRSMAAVWLSAARRVAFGAVQPLDLEVAVVDARSRGAPSSSLRLAAADAGRRRGRRRTCRPAREQVGGGQPGDAGADDAHVDMHVLAAPDRNSGISTVADQTDW